MDTNIIYNIDCVAGMNQMIDDESIDLIIADPPYFKVIGEKWDYLWRTEEDYLEWSEKWIAEAARVLRMGGSFYLFGYFRMLSRLLPILEKYGFELRQQIVLNKGMQAVSGRATKNYRMFPNVTESILFLCKDPKPFAKSFLKQMLRAPHPDLLRSGWLLPFIVRTYALSFLLLPFNIFSTYYFQAIMKPKAAFVVSVARGLVISGILIMVLPALVNADAIWFAMPVTELLVMLYAASMIRKYTRALPGGTTYADTRH